MGCVSSKKPSVVEDTAEQREQERRRDEERRRREEHEAVLKAKQKHEEELRLSKAQQELLASLAAAQDAAAKAKPPPSPRPKKEEPPAQEYVDVVYEKPKPFKRKPGIKYGVVTVGKNKKRSIFVRFREVEENPDAVRTESIRLTLQQKEEGEKLWKIFEMREQWLQNTKKQLGFGLCKSRFKDKHDFHEDLNRALSLVNFKHLTTHDKLSYEAFQAILDENLEEYKHSPWIYASSMRQSVHKSFQGFCDSYMIRSEKSIAKYEEKVHQFVELMDEMIDSWREGMKDGRVMWDECVKQLIKQLKVHDTKKRRVETTVYYRPMARLDQSGHDWKPTSEQRGQFVSLIEHYVLPAHRRMVEFLEKTYLPHARKEPGLWSVPGGSAYYDFLIRRFTTDPQMTVEDVHQMGLAEATAIRDDIIATCKKMGLTLDENAHQDLTTPTVAVATTDDTDAGAQTAVTVTAPDRAQTTAAKRALTTKISAKAMKIKQRKESARKRAMGGSKGDLSRAVTSVGKGDKEDSKTRGVTKAAADDDDDGDDADGDGDAQDGAAETADGAAGDVSSCDEEEKEERVEVEVDDIDEDGGEDGGDDEEREAGEGGGEEEGSQDGSDSANDNKRRKGSRNATTPRHIFLKVEQDGADDSGSGGSGGERRGKNSATPSPPTSPAEKHVRRKSDHQNVESEAATGRVASTSPAPRKFTRGATVPINSANNPSSPTARGSTSTVAANTAANAAANKTPRELSPSGTTTPLKKPTLTVPSKKGARGSGSKPTTGSPSSGAKTGGPERSFASFAQLTKHIKTRKEYFYAEGEWPVQYYADALEAAKPKLPLFFSARSLPSIDLEVKEMNRYPGASAVYAAGNAERSARLSANVHEYTKRHKFSSVASALHEGIGHHFQRSLANTLVHLPPFRKNPEIGRNVAFTEGWAHYLEWLGTQMDSYRDVSQYLGYLNLAMVRAARMVVDTGIHHMHWSRDQAVEWMNKHTLHSLYEVQSEVDRMILTPAKGVAYTVGARKVKSLLDMAQKELGDLFSWTGFHDVVMGEGALPLHLLTKNVYEWIDTTKRLNRME